MSDLLRKLTAWNAASPFSGDFKLDCDGRLIRWQDYGARTQYGWEIDHRVSLGAGGLDELSNLRARHWEGNGFAGGVFGALLSRGDIPAERAAKSQAANCLARERFGLEAQVNALAAALSGLQPWGTLSPSPPPADSSRQLTGYLSRRK